MDALRSMKKQVRKATRVVTRSSHDALHNIIEEEGDLCKALEHVTLERDDSITYIQQWADTTGQASMKEFVTAMEPQFRAQIDAEARFVLAQQAYIAMWQELLVRERERDTLGKTLAKAEDAVLKAQEKVTSATAAKRPALESKLNEAIAARDAAKADFEPVAAQVAAFTRQHVKAGFQAWNEAQVQMLESSLNIARQRQAIIERIDLNAADVIAPPAYTPEP
eukprot:a952_278.p3 GENE.a952_278~~a952_278.p3  ORF type:complete len:232 (+),score=96.00 a952_278:28-696(+)